jgi:integrase
MYNGYIWDSSIAGFGVRTNKNIKSYIFRSKGEKNPITIGRVGVITLQQARKQAVSLSGASLSMKTITFEDLGSEWLESWAEFYRKSTLKEDKRRLEKRIYPALAEKLVNEVTKRDLLILHNRITIDGPVEANRCLALVRAIYNKGSEWGLFEGKNPAIGIKSNSEKSRERTANEDEIERLLKVCREHPWGTFFMICLYTGMRRGEVCKLRWENINLKEGSILIKRTKNGKDHTVYIGDELRTRLVFLKTPSPWVFVSSQTGSHVKSPKRAWKQICYEAKIEGLTIHDLRRTFATKLLEAGIPIEHISKALNHSSISVTQGYLHMSEKQNKETFKKAIALFS